MGFDRASKNQIAHSDALNAENRHWFIAQLKPAGFSRARRNLARQGYRTFMPLQTVTRRRGSRLRTEERPLFPGYIFVEILPGKSTWRSINGTSGVSKLVTLGGQLPTEVPSMVIGALRARLREDGHVLAPSDFAVGDRVRVVAGPFANSLARIEELTDKERIIALFEMMGREVRATLTPADLEKV